ncbi:MAG: YmdB family metallophosphoesterase, partial [Candidatus Hydrothermae bacterium]|nr:YmdB family metallophosphoesterase [Candidatus Hydrothermae bacterium]
GGLDGVIGVRKEEAIRRFRTGVPQPFTVEDRRPGVEGVLITLGAPRHALSIEAFRMEVHTA